MSTAAATLATEVRAIAGKSHSPNLAATVSRDDLAAALRWAASAVPSQTSLPILQGALLHASGGSLTVTTFDYEISAQQSILAPGASGHALVPSRLLTSMLHVIPRKADLRLTISDTGKDVRLCLDAGDDLHMELPTLPVSEWPEPPEPGEPLFALSGERFAQLARATIAAGRDDTLPVLTGVLIQSRDGKIEAAATDRYRLAVTTVKGHFPDRLSPILVPARIIDRLGKAFVKEAEVHVYLNRPTSPGYDLATFVSGSRILHARLLDGEFPKYRNLMDVPTTATANLAAAPLAEAVRQAAIVVRRSPIVMENLGADAIEVTGGVYADATGEASVRRKVREVDWDGELLRIAVNPDYFTAGLRALGGENVRLKFGGAAKPLTMHNPDDDGFTYLVMPVRLAG